MPGITIGEALMFSEFSIQELSELEEAGVLVSASATPAVAEFIDPSGALRDAGLLRVEEERPGHYAPMPTRESHTPEDFERALGLYLEGAIALRKAHYDAMGYDYGPGETFAFTIESEKPGPKYIRIVNVDRGVRASVYSFIERSTGDVFKPESFTKPAKHARGNIFSAKHGLDTHTQYGPAYLR